MRQFSELGIDDWNVKDAVTTVSFMSGKLAFIDVHLPPSLLDKYVDKYEWNKLDAEGDASDVHATTIVKDGVHISYYLDIPMQKEEE